MKILSVYQKQIDHITSVTSDTELMVSELVDLTKDNSNPDLSRKILRLLDVVRVLKADLRKLKAEQSKMSETEKQIMLSTILTNLDQRDKINAFDYAMNAYDRDFFHSIADIDFRQEVAASLLDYFGEGYQLELWKLYAGS